uniref:Uncharacterized protein n=1 Tax=Rhipicephalus appendiculatus TaxID=34631 RepID=A0A131YCF3_RHIAP
MRLQNFMENKNENNDKLSCSTVALYMPSQARIRMPEPIKGFRTLSKGKCGAAIYYLRDRNGKIYWHNVQLVLNTKSAFCKYDNNLVFANIKKGSGGKRIPIIDTATHLVQTSHLSFNLQKHSAFRITFAEALRFSLFPYIVPCMIVAVPYNLFTQHVQ